jgi:hypothetical protein
MQLVLRNSPAVLKHFQRDTVPITLFKLLFISYRFTAVQLT